MRLITACLLDPLNLGAYLLEGKEEVSQQVSGEPAATEEMVQAAYVRRLQGRGLVLRGKADW